MGKEFVTALAQGRTKAQRHLSQFEDFIQAQNDLIASGACLLTGASDGEDYEQFLRLVAHVEQLWSSSCNLYRSQNYPQAVFIAITCIEETGKIGVARFQLMHRAQVRLAGIATESTTKVSRKRNPFFSHAEKHLLAAGAGAIINSRLDRLLGIERVSQFLDDVRTGAIERLRQSALYADLGNHGPVLPCDHISSEQAQLYVVLAGELMAEILGIEPDEWERLIETVTSFEREIAATPTKAG